MLMRSQKKLLPKLIKVLPKELLLDMITQKLEWGKDMIT